jgi:WD40 repeat protein
MIIGDSNGQTALFNVINGAKIKALPKHTAEVTSIVHAPDITAFFTAAMDNRIQMTLDNEFGESELLRKFHIQESVITLITYEPMTKLLLVGTNTGQIAFFETDTSKLHGTSYESSNIEEITSINLINQLPFLISTNS